MNDNDLIWEAYTKQLEEGWGKNLAMMGVGALAAYGGMKHKSEPTPQPKHTQVQQSAISKQAQNNKNKSDYKHALSKSIGKSNWTEVFYVPLDKSSGKPLLSLKDLNSLRKSYNQSEISPETYQAAPKNFR